MNTIKRRAALSAGILALALSACGADPSPTVNPMNIAGTAQAAALTMVAQTQVTMPTVTLLPTVRAEPLLTVTPVVLADCFVTFHFAAWKDFEGNGLWDRSEPPLMGVKFSVPDGFAQVWGHPYLPR